MWKHLLLAPVCVCLIYLTAFHGKTPGGDIARRQRLIEEAKPDVVFIGNSMVNKGVDPKLFEERTGLKGLICHQSGSASRWWYLCIKNVVCQAKHKPQAIYLAFRDHFLTDAHFRTQGRYAVRIRTVAKAEDQGEIPWWEWGPMEAKERWDTRIAKTAADICGVTKFDQFEAMAAVFDDKQMNRLEITQRQLAAEERKEEELYRFESQLPNSYLPKIIALCQDHGIKLVLCRVKKRRDTPSNQEPPELQRYLADLRHYLEEKNVQLIDATNCEAIELAHFGPGDHMNRQGRAVMTEFVANETI